MLEIFFQVEDELLMKRSLSGGHDLDSLDGGSSVSGSVSGSSSRRTWTSTRRSFFKRRKGGRSSSRDSKELASYSDVASLSCADSQGALHDAAEAQINSYIRVERLDCKQHIISIRTMFEQFVIFLIANLCILCIVAKHPFAKTTSLALNMSFIDFLNFMLT